MRQQFCGLAFWATLALWTSGCSLVQPAELNALPEPSRQMSMDELREIESFLVWGETSGPPLDPKQLKVGQHVQVIAGGSPKTLDQEVQFLTSRIAGTVKEISDDRVVLQDVVMIKQVRSQQAVPVVSKVPYLSRLFKNTGVGREVTAVPGEVTIELSEILHAKELTDSGFAEVREFGVERIGVDFNVEDGRPVMAQQQSELPASPDLQYSAD